MIFVKLVLPSDHVERWQRHARLVNPHAPPGTAEFQKREEQEAEHQMEFSSQARQMQEIPQLSAHAGVMRFQLTGESWLPCSCLIILN